MLLDISAMSSRPRSFLTGCAPGSRARSCWSATGSAARFAGRRRVGATIGLRPTLWIASVGAITGLLWALPSPLRRLRDLPEQAD
jgi:hypothetical protein